MPLNNKGFYTRATNEPRFFTNGAAAELGISTRHLYRLLEEGCISEPQDQLPLKAGGMLLLWTRPEISRARLELVEHKVRWLAERKLKPGTKVSWEIVCALVSETEPGRKLLAQLDQVRAQVAAELERRRANVPTAESVMSGAVETNEVKQQ